MLLNENEEQITAYQLEINKKKAELIEIKKTYDDRVRQINKAIIDFSNKIAELGGEVEDTTSSNNPDGGEKTNEAAQVRINSKRQYELSNLLFDSINNVRDISNNLNIEQCMNLSRILIRDIDILRSSDKEVTFEVLCDRIKRYFSNKGLSYLDREYANWFDELRNTIALTDNNFKFLIENNIVQDDNI